VLDKLGFSDTGLATARYGCARAGEAMTRLYQLRLAPDEEGCLAA